MIFLARLPILTLFPLFAACAHQREVVVLDEHRNPVFGAEVVVAIPQTMLAKPAITDANGHAQILVPNDALGIQVTRPGYPRTWFDIPRRWESPLILMPIIPLSPEPDPIDRHRFRIGPTLPVTP